MVFFGIPPGRYVCPDVRAGQSGILFSPLPPSGHRAVFKNSLENYIITAYISTNAKCIFSNCNLQRNIINFAYCGNQLVCRWKYYSPIII